MKKEEKTNVMRVLDSKKIKYESHSYDPDPTKSGEEIAAVLGEVPERVYKTLVTEGKTGQHYVFVVPVKAELDLKKAAKAAGERTAASRQSSSAAERILFIRIMIRFLPLYLLYADTLRFNCKLSVKKYKVPGLSGAKTMKKSTCTDRKTMLIYLHT